MLTSVDISVTQYRDLFDMISELLFLQYLTHCTVYSPKENKPCNSHLFDQSRHPKYLLTVARLKDRVMGYRVNVSLWDVKVQCVCILVFMRGGRICQMHLKTKIYTDLSHCRISYPLPYLKSKCPVTSQPHTT